MFGIGIIELVIIAIVAGLIIRVATGGWRSTRSQSGAATRQPNLRHCPGCGGPTSQDDENCPHCGLRLSA